MKKSIFILSVIFLSFNSFAQKGGPIEKDFIPQTKLKTSLVKTLPTVKSIAIWSDDFSDPVASNFNSDAIIEDGSSTIIVNYVSDLFLST